MDNLNEKVWFVYIGDHHEGPFSILEIKVKISNSEIDPNSYVWKEGMGDWEIMEKIPDFSVALSSSPTLEEQGGARLSVEESNSFSQSEVIHQEEEEKKSEKELPGESVMDSQELVIEKSNDNDFSEEKESDSDYALEPMEVGEDPSKLIAIEESKTFTIETKTKDASEGFEPGKSGSLDLPEVPLKSPSRTVAPYTREGDEDTGSSFPHIEEEIEIQKKSSKLVFLGLLVALMMGGGYLYYAGYLKPYERYLPNVTLPNFSFLVDLKNKIPFLAKEKIELNIPEFTTEQLERALEIVQADLSKDGPRLGVFTVRNESPQPSIYILSNLPSGAQFNVYMEGQPGTMVNRLNFQLPLRPLVVENHVAFSELSQNIEGGVLPQGVFRIYAFNTQLETQPPEVLKWLKDRTAQIPSDWSSVIPKDRQIISEKTVFLGGAKDSHYHSKLEGYLKERREKSDAVFVEIEQFFQTLKMQHSSLTNEFKRINAIGNRNQRLREWDKFSGAWDPLMTSLNNSFTQWNDDYFEKVVFFIRLHKMVKETAGDLRNLFEIQTKVIQKNKIKDKGKYDEELKTQEELVFRKVRFIDNQIKKIKAEPASTTGLPRGLDS